MDISTEGLRNYLEYANIYKGNASKKKVILFKWLFMDALLIN